jgi:tetratricopeptide (TPR) repeat protein
MIFLLLVMSIETRIDSLENAYTEGRQFETLLALHECYLVTNQYHKSMSLLGQADRHFHGDTTKSKIMFELASVFMFVGEIDKAHDHYLGLVSRYPKLDIANDAADRLYLMETARDDTVQLKRLINVIRLIETAQYLTAADSARVLLKTPVGAYAHYYLALAYRGLGDLTLTQGALEALNVEYPDHRIYEAIFLEANVYMILDELASAEEILQDLIMREPNTIYAAKARQELKKLKVIPE